jgi:hypothetical protein
MMINRIPVNMQSIVSKVWASCQPLFSDVVSWVCRGVMPSSPALLPSEKGVLTAHPVLSPSVLSPSPLRRGIKGEVIVHKGESTKHSKVTLPNYASNP